MAKKLLLMMVLLLALIFAGCGGNQSGGDVASVQILDGNPSELYTDADLAAAYQEIKDVFRKEFAGCTLTKLYYPGDSAAGGFQEWAAQYDADEAIIILSSFTVDSSGGDGSLNPNSTYEDWQWILIRQDGGAWQHVDHGY